MKNKIYKAFSLTSFLSLAGCMGIYEGGFECPAGVGVGCKSISDVNTMVNQGDIPKASPEPLIIAKPEIWYAPPRSVQRPISSIRNNASENSYEISFPKKVDRRRTDLSDV